MVSSRVGCLPLTTRAFLSILTLTILLPGQAALAQKQSNPVSVPNSRPAPAAQPVKPAAPEPSPAAAPDIRDLRVEFSHNELEIPDIGLSVKVPADCDGSRMITPSASPRASQEIALQIMSDSWSVKISAPRVSNPNLTADRCADEAFKMLEANIQSADHSPGLNKPVQKLTLIDRVPNDKDPRKQLFGGPGRQVEFVRWYAKVPQSNNLPATVRGLVVAKVGDTRFVTFDLTTTEPHYPEAKKMLEAIVAASTFKTPREALVDQRDAIQAGVNLKRELTYDNLKSIIAAKPELWLRIYKPAANGQQSDDTEVGYIRYQFIDGQRGLVDRTKSKAAWGAAEREAGCVILSDLRYLDKNRVIDSQQGYFLKRDASAEFWSLETALRDLAKPDDPDVLREMGVREDQSMQIETSSNRGDTQSTTPLMRPDQTYLSRVEELLVPQLLVKAQTQADYAYYTWVPGAGRIRLRHDTVERIDSTPIRWKISTRYGDDAVTMTSLYESNGAFIRTELADGSVIEPSSCDDLIKLWKSKGLPVGSITSRK